MPEKSPIDNDARGARRGRRDATDPPCFLCNRRVPRALVRWVKANDLHHIVGRHFDKRATVPLCARCHDKVTELYRKAGVTMDAPVNVFAAVLSVLRSCGTWLPLVGKRLLTLADQMEHTLDRHLPQWRSIREMV